MYTKNNNNSNMKEDSVKIQKQNEFKEQMKTNCKVKKKVQFIDVHISSTTKLDYNHIPLRRQKACLDNVCVFDDDEKNI